MATLFKKLQIQNSYFDQLYQLLLFHRHEKPEFLLGIMSPKAFLLSFLNRLWSRQGK